MIQVGQGATIVKELNTSLTGTIVALVQIDTVPFGNECLRTTAIRQNGLPEHP